MLHLVSFCCCLSLAWTWTTYSHQIPSYRGSSSQLFQFADNRDQKSQETTEKKVEKLGQYFKKNIRRLRESSQSLDLVFLVDESSSVGHTNFVNELRFVKKLLSDFPVVPSATRVAIVTFSSKTNVQTRVDYISSSQPHQHKCSLLNREIPAITYKGGGTYTKGAFQQAAQILRYSRSSSTKVIFLITDGYSNGGDPRPIAANLRDLGVEIFTVGIWQGNIRELHDMASHPKEEHCYFLHSFAEFEALARRALHEDLPSGSYIQEDTAHCSYLCETGKDCCDVMASCKCGTHTGQYECICEKGYYGKGLQYECTACPAGTYKPESSPGGASTCIPCPDPNHNSPPGSTSIDDCVCKSGYEADSHVCKVVQCPELLPPENGYFIHNICNNNFDAACGIRCKAGYDLVGSSIRLCQPNGIWTGSDATCRVQTCPKLHALEHGRINCSAGDISYGTVCYASCDEGYVLEGSSKLFCLENSQWDAKMPHCKEIHCPVFSKPNGVLSSPSNCGQEPAMYGYSCHIKCQKGFALSGVHEKIKCIANGIWSGDIHKAVCRDTEPPNIVCPEDILGKNAEHQNSALINWKVPNATDNSGKEVLIQVSPAFQPPYVFPIGEFSVTYTATDISGNQASCTFNIKVIDVDPPVIDRCRSPPIMQVTGNEEFLSVMWEEPQFSDNSGAPLVITKTHSPGVLFPVGKTLVQYTATDPAGNQMICDIHITVKGSPCEIPFTPQNGKLVCLKDVEGTNCTLVCKEGYALAEGTVQSFYCAFRDGLWIPHRNADWPDCALNRFANHGFKSFEMLYKATRCDDSSLLKNFADAFQSSLGKMVPSFCTDVDDIDCQLEDQHQRQCLEYNYDYENGFAIGPAGWGAANKLDYSYDDGFDATDTEDAEKPLSDSPVTVPSRVKRHRKVNVGLADQKVKFIFNITAMIPLPDQRNDTAELENQQRLLRTLETITNRLKRILRKEPLHSFQFSSEMIIADSNSLEDRKAILFCRPGTVLKGRMCVNCPKGTYYSLEHHACESCWTGSYQDEEGQLDCKSCPAGTYTEYLHSKRISECKVPCHAGEFSRSGFIPCYPCPRDYYQPERGKSYCLSCPFYGTTTITGARCQCPDGFTGQTCEVNVDECSSSPCLNNATVCDGFNSYVCNPTWIFWIQKLMSLSKPCLNNGVCDDLKAGFHCLCPVGYTGKICEKDMMNVYVFIYFRCQCPDGFTGQTCEVNVDECSSSPCLNNATCVDGFNSYVCKCPPGFSGSEQPFGFNLDFEVSGIYGYAMLDNGLPSLSAITCAFWMRSSDTTNYGTPISYALDNDSDNTFLLTDYNGWVLYVNGKERITDCPSVNDGRWHHIAVSWTNTDGSWKVYIDGRLSDGGKGLSVGENIPGGGSLVLAQEQDMRGEGFNPAESFVGSISQLNIWDHPLTSDQVQSLAVSCPSELQKGNVLAWADFLSGVVGRVKVDHKSKFCADCAALEGTSLHLHTSSSELKPGSMLTLFCDPGFQIVGSSELHCLNRGEWDQPIPHCERISCGKPPRLENGLYNAEDLYAGSTVTYQCNIGYYLLGDSRMFCTDNGIWNGISPQCLDVNECGVGSDCDEHASCHNTNGSYICTCIPPYRGNGKKCLEPIKCKNPGELENGNYSGNNFSVGNQLMFSCHEGYDLIGKRKVICLESGEWNEVLPYCQAVSCGRPTAPSNGDVVGSNFTFGETVSFRCNEGYTLIGNEETMCLSNGSWSHKQPSCESVTCSKPKDIENGLFSLSGLTFKAMATYRCLTGYSLQGHTTLICEASGKWSSDAPSCQHISCGPPPQVKDAVTNGNNFTYANIITYRCKEGYTLVGPEKISCLSTGKWSEEIPQCMAVSCDEPPNVEHASSDSSHRLFGDIAYYYCSDGYIMVDNTHMLCNTQGKWVPPDGKKVPHCIADFCERPPLVAYSILESVNKAKFVSGSTVSFKCMEGFVLNTSAKIECLRGGQWNPSPLSIQCIPIRCGEPASIKNGYVSGNNYSFDAIVAYSCNKGYYIKGEKKRTCQASGEWSGRFPVCYPVSCSEPLPLENGFVKSKTGILYEDEVVYSCNPGFKLVGSNVRVCQFNRQWYSESPPSCVLLSCEKPPQFEHGYHKGERYEVGSKVEFFCVEGYELIGEINWTCQKNGQWNKKQIPSCVPSKCKDPPLSENKLVLREVPNEVGVVMFFCREGYVLEGSSVLKCLPSQQWNDSFPVCKLVLCPQPPELTYGGPISITSLHFGSTVKYSCVDGFLLKGESVITCNASGTWSPEFPNCSPIDCPQPEEIPNGIVDVQGLTFLSAALYTCKPGYELIGNSTLICGSDGQWQGGQPGCHPVKCSGAKEIPNGSFVSQSLHYGQTISYTCKRGFRLEGQSVLTCLETGEWNSEPPFCKEITCSTPEPIENGFVEGADHRYGAMIIYSCMPGFQLSGLAMQTCEESGWSSSTPVCLPTDCGLPPHIDFGLYSVVRYEEKTEEELTDFIFSTTNIILPPPTATNYELSYLYGTHVIYTCYNGYKIIGSPVIFCQEDGMWNGSAPACTPIECTIPTIPKNGVMHYTDNAIGSTVHYECKPGYELIGSEKSRCLANREWSSEIPLCVITLCKPPNKILHGYIEALNYSYMSIVHYKCEIGYQIYGSSQRTCQDNKQWDGEEPICIPVSCGQPPLLINGQVKGIEYTFSKTVQYVCNEGYRLYGDIIRTCLENGNWSGTTPSCSEIKCKPPSSISNGEVTDIECGVGKEIMYKCNEGYKIEGASKLTCLNDGTWDVNAPLCEPVHCEPPPNVSHGFLNSSSFRYNEYIQYACFPGYEMHGSPTRQCLANGFWSGSPPTCVACECSPPVVQNGLVIGDSFTCGHSVSIKCHEGFKLLGPSQLVCLSAGKWSSGFPHCGRISCGTPPSIKNAFINGSSPNDENAIRYSCVAGYVMQGKSELLCTKEGEWSKPYPHCQILLCGLPPIVLNTVVVADTYTYGSTATYRCQDGYLMNKEVAVKTCLENGSWSLEEIVCVSRKCLLQSSIIKIKDSETEFDINKTITIVCKEGYMLRGPSVSTCMSDGNWVPEVTDDVCTPVSCGKPSAPANGIVLGTRFFYQDTILYQCNTGYETHGPTERVCQANKLWSDMEPQCKKISCGAPEPLENGIMLGVGHLFGNEIHYSCNPGFELQGPSRRICHLDKLWLPSPPKCISVTCDTLPHIANAAYILSGNTYMQNVTYTCNIGYYLVGSPNVTCQVNGTWKIRCEIPGYLENGQIEYDNVTVGSIVKYQCHTGYSLEGERFRECTTDGKWNHPVPLCKPANPCPVPFVIPENAVLMETNFYVGQKVSLKCRKGYQLQGQAILMCNDDETWTDTKAKCEKISCGPPIIIQNGIVRGMHHQFGDMVTYSCYSGYMLMGTMKSVCLENGTWTAPPSCKAVCRFPCQNGGVCERPNACSCPSGWMGRLCEEPICPLPCLNGGRCSAPFKCDCTSGWTGSRCHTAVCQSPCLNGGICVRPNRCHCPPSWSGPDCSR
ncbi:hypothetical protein GDO86_001318 [Hymenochirus boettgeri]|uniref:Sushi, von Willebrand factor type A, EGF and pentraxin domain containing 1 n=1 Tax=Hymenochirus boettgeri TaxID=247094 RepID=A0A8T2KF94_9PIPI|nr:hypothetical protein GDO86_001318 [Hymenochirus boettgeri]